MHTVCHLKHSFTHEKLVKIKANIYLFNLTENGRSCQALCLMGYLWIFRYSKSNMVVRTLLLYVDLQNLIWFCVHRLFDCSHYFIYINCISQFGCEQYRLMHVSSQCFSRVSNSFWINMNPSVFFPLLRTSGCNTPSHLKPNEPVRPQHVVLNRKTTVIRPMRGIFSESLWNILYMTHRAQRLLHILEWHHKTVKYSSFIRL